MKLKLIFILTALTSFITFADSIYFSPSLYYTGGDYSDKSSSGSYAGFLSLGNYKQRILLSYDNLQINHSDWKYKQNYFNAGGIIGFTGFYLKLNYGHVSGTYRSLNERLTDNYHNDLYSIDAFYTDYTSYLGGSYSYQDQEGYITKDIHQAMLRYEFIPHWRVLLAAKPLYTSISDGRDLWGINLRVHYLPFDYFLVKLHGFIGERAYFFDPDLLVLYNQDETQKYLGALQLEYFLSLHLNLIGGFQHTSFGSYKINYYILGIRTNLLF